METYCSGCSWWGVARNGRICFKCDKIANYVPEKSLVKTDLVVGGETISFYHDADFGVEPAPESDAIHNWFELSYASYLALPRAVLQHMPQDWQNRFVQCLNELSDLVDFDDNYSVNLRDSKGRFKRDPLSQYKRFPKNKVPWRK